MKLYTFYTDTHTNLFDKFFAPSIAEVKDIELVARKSIQQCPSGSYMDNGWLDTMKFKVQLHIEASQNYKDNFYIYSDCDVMFYDTNLVQYLLEELEDCDMAFQNDVEPYGWRPTCCAGFFISKCNQETTKLWQDVLYSLNLLSHDTKHNDQSLLNSELNHHTNIRYKLLSNRFFTLAQHTKAVWDSKNNNFDFNIPFNMITYHANWTHGVDNKIKLLELVKLKRGK